MWQSPSRNCGRLSPSPFPDDFARSGKWFRAEPKSTASGSKYRVPAAPIAGPLKSPGTEPRRANVHWLTIAVDPLQNGVGLRSAPFSLKSCLGFKPTAASKGREKPNCEREQHESPQSPDRNVHRTDHRGVLFLRDFGRDLRADDCAFLTCSRNRSSSRIRILRLVIVSLTTERRC